jgi:hypothetical protein
MTTARTSGTAAATTVVATSGRVRAVRMTDGFVITNR